LKKQKESNFGKKIKKGKVGKKWKGAKKSEKKEECTIDYYCTHSALGVGEQWFPHTL
jgi:hypothetical protein